LGYRLQDLGGGFKYHKRQGIFLFQKDVQTSCGANPALYLSVIWGFSPAEKHKGIAA
jgi:hypothetical protein